MFQKEYIFFLSLKGTRTMFAQSLKCSPSGPQCVLGMPALPGSSRLEQQLFCVSLSVQFHLEFRVSEHSVSEAQGGLEFMLLLPQPPVFWDHRCVPPRLAYSVSSPGRENQM